MKDTIYVSPLNIGYGILSGGMSKRMNGADKLMLNIGNTPCIKKIYDSIASPENTYFSVCDEKRKQSISASIGTLDDRFYIFDKISEFGPVEGIYNLLNEMPHDAVFIIPGDTPFISRELINAVIANYRGEDVLVIGDNADGCSIRIHPTIGIYNKSVLKQLDEMRKNNIHKIRVLFDNCTARIVSIEELGFEYEELLNINTPADYKRITEHEDFSGCRL